MNVGLEPAALSAVRIGVPEHCGRGVGSVRARTMTIEVRTLFAFQLDKEREPTYILYLVRLLQQAQIRPSHKISVDSVLVWLDS